MRGPLHDLHERLGARFVPFAGFDMPVMYSSIKEEHARVRDAVGLFDVSHMSNLLIQGDGAEALLQRCTPSLPEKLKQGRGVYTCITADDGTILDDTIYTRDGDGFRMVPNAGMNELIANHLKKHAADVDGAVEVIDESRDTAILALQGPRAPDTLARATDEVPPTPRFATHGRQIEGVPVRVATTGYTGESGFEVFCPADSAPAVFEALLEEGAEHGILPIGLGARDTLRLEMAYALAGHEFKGGRTPLEAGLGWTVKWDHNFVGKEVLVAQKESGHYDRLVGLKITGRGIPREEYPVLDTTGAAIGTVTSGTLSPTLGYGIALAYVPAVHAAVGTSLAVEVRGKPVAAEVVKTPFLKR